MVRSITLGVAAGLALAASANAADIGNRDSYGPAWTGFYIGVNGGYASDAINGHGGVQDDGGFGGGQIGYNWQRAFGFTPRLVLGIEADFQGTGIDHTGNGSLFFSNGRIDSDLHTRSIDYFGTVRGRLGYAAGPALFYVTGGLAYGNEKNIITDLGPNTTAIGVFPIGASGAGNVYRANGVQTGYTIGGGLEYKIAPVWSLKVEYQYIDLDADRPVGNLGGFVVTKDTELNTVRVGINYHFESALSPLK
jgi:outer membrane immunogenic protein